MQTTTKTYKIFGITVFSFTVTANVDEEAVYTRMSDRFKAEMEAALVKARKPRE